MFDICVWLCLVIWMGSVMLILQAASGGGQESKATIDVPDYPIIATQLCGLVKT
ncbi:hypothetical protein BDV39DRAFT_169699 [Aspergillus sergii]|uniref:Uncharacterized protein n=1 Tax=Aspergillus sergii TaxID=1034303 RepID=A0A5N6XDT1_9EURO|nr:hypothetical protein BDV39DRAFT_169699 [Aspergillus sergii]